MEAVEETPIKIAQTKKPRSEKQIEAFQKALAKKAELSLINKQFNDAKKQQKEDVVEHKERIIKSVEKVEVEVEPDVQVEVEEIKKEKRKNFYPFLLLKVHLKAKRKKK
ncbi:hypothetical protein T484DRAFT_1758634 [Baffinella frigidus]|nr:hypothetical protein T484DRAFT_1758634 [Cryptophyta sp. CCMP2293]